VHVAYHRVTTAAPTWLHAVPYLLRSFLKGIPDAPADWSADPAKERTKVAPLWEEIQAAVHAHGEASARARMHTAHQQASLAEAQATPSGRGLARLPLIS
jgi:hypothetical protein